MHEGSAADYKGKSKCTPVCGKPFNRNENEYAEKYHARCPEQWLCTKHAPGVSRNQSSQCAGFNHT